ncbi:DNA-binding domain-containing protein [Oceanimonas sp. CHS3-5]|uniref:HvfC/BufC N-terminal domain-containing protein n=1 Tax=Oceanimonas sp. CHS3-5 TaxID=3068186 RepID=UPI00273D34F5|nr:DNA-binding domain-containing protein [Oceanimonas sp. CHS3-5]MDP5293624.1 DNA-binding domain-containing protein [Oceanimonas sp. CHS3-5]
MLDAFLDALLHASQPVPDEVAPHPGRRARFNVYRNNVRVSLTDALAALFPVCRQLVGEDFFNAMAGIYIEQSPPASPLLTDYGTGLPAFIDDFAPAASVPYLADMARLELLVQRVQHAADATPVASEALQALLADPARLTSHGLQLSPACALLHSSFAVGSIWLAHHGDGRLGDIQPARAENLLLLRSRLSVKVLCLNEADAAFMAALMAGQSLGSALEHTAQGHAGFNPATLLQCLLAHQAITGVDFKGEA